MIVIPAGLAHGLEGDEGDEDEPSDYFDRSGGGEGRGNPADDGDDDDDENDDEASFELVGAYPVGSSSWDMCGRETFSECGAEEIERRIRDVPWFTKDPVYGDVGPVLEW